METDHRRQVGSINHSKRIQIGVSKLASFLWNQRNSCQRQKSRYFNFGSKKFARKSSNRTCTFCRQSPRFLQYLLFSSKKIGSIPSGDKSETPQPVSQNTTFQDGYYEDSSKSGNERRLGFICRPKRCILSHLNSSKSQKISKVLHKRESLSVPSLSFRSKNFTKGLHKGRSCSSSSFEDAEHQTSSVFRRLVSSECNQTNAFQRQRQNSKSPFSTRFSDKCRKIKSGTDTRYYIHRGKVSVRQGNCHANYRQDVKIKRIRNGTKGKYCVSKAISASSWCNGLCIEIIPNARLYMRPIQLHLLHWWKPVSRDLDAWIPKSQHLLDHLNWWSQEANIARGRSLSQGHINKVIATDASNQGWGGNLGHQIVQGTWSTAEKKLHINCLEMEAVILTIRNFLPQLGNQSVLIRSDNSTVVQYINRQGVLGPHICATKLGNFG